MLKGSRAVALFGFFWLAVSMAGGVMAKLPDFTGLVEKNSAAVVNISTTQKVASGVPSLPDGVEIPEGSPLDEFFKHYFGDG